ncbi:hypothetical protein FYK55_18945 [Roseiconus nitratireducens]|uniref:DZANK-type domain-containing protein n=1 Tax=Roseiconus nitratireducens TaxID=2605748 RepID=A0A5M6D0H8_9BACT|nr:pilus assembly protein PilM [Roseiconus nitratireducens]KAA5540981.1 hypothetical protein FYK55_18945 [Roseiconus nitratireducens]
MTNPSQVDALPTSPSAAAISCGACGQSNPPAGQFCAKCGHTLYEPCGGCTKPVLLSQAFCGNCGRDLAVELKKTRQRFEANLADAIAAAKERDFDRAESLLALVIGQKDYRYSDLISNAKLAREKIKSIASQEVSNAGTTIEQAEQAHREGNPGRVIELLSPLPRKLLTERACEILEQSQTLVEQVVSGEKQLQSAIEKRDWESAGGLLDHLVELQPDNATYNRLAAKVGQKLLSKTAKLRDGHRYSAARRMLDAVPTGARGEDFEQLRKTVDRLAWLSTQFSGEPFVTPTLGRIAKKWSEEAPADSEAASTMQRIGKLIKQPRASTRDIYVPWQAARRSWLGGPLGFLAFPSCVDRKDDAAFRSAPGQLNVAIGLALQGLGRGRIGDDFKPKKGLLTRLGRKKSTVAWGVDIGSQGLRAVRLQTGADGKPFVADSHLEVFERPITRVVDEATADQTIRSAVEAFLEEKDVEDAPVWVSFPARELVSRFVQLPPVVDKQAKLLFQKEVESRIPLPLDEVADVRWIAEMPDEDTTILGRPAFVSAAKKTFVSRYLDNLEQAGLKVDGLQATPIALLNFSTVEFEDEFRPDVDQEQDREAPNELPAVAVIDCGAETTTTLIVSAESCWFWSFESGGDDFTRLLSRATKKTHGEADQLKRNPALLSDPASDYAPVVKRMEELRGRLSKIVADFKRENDSLRIDHTWCCGGGARTHGWMKHVIANQ